MILEAKKTDFEYKNGDIYFGFGLFINLHLNKIYVIIRRPSDLTPVLEELSKFNVINSSDILDWEKKIESNGLCITIQPTELYGFDWDLYHDGNEKENNSQFKTECSNCTHRLLLISVLCNYFARENHNYPFCSPAFIL